MKFSSFGIAIALWILFSGAQMISEVPAHEYQDAKRVGYRRPVEPLLTTQFQLRTFNGSQDITKTIFLQVTSDHKSCSVFEKLRTQEWSRDRRPHADYCHFDNAFRCSAEEQCLPEEAKCDGVTDCPDGTDESVAVCGCLPHEFFCNNTCIDQILLCDTRADCTDHSDEQNCEAYVCPSSHFKCDNHFCVPTETVCNFVDDCGDNSDERNCAFRRCWYGEYQCDNRQCVSGYSVCDGKEDCIDGSDEKLCDLNAHFAVCGDGSKAHISVWCDGWPDCPDNHADELLCRNCTRGEFRCPNTRCIRSSMVCDMVCDCAGTCDDELNCEHRYTTRNGIRLCDQKGTIACPREDRCIADDFVCDGRNDCFYGDEGSEESGCGFSKDHCAEFNNTFWCTEGRCLPKSVRCNHRRDCLNAEDEENCDFPSCENNEFRCDNGFCIDLQKRCNAFYDCTDKSDETECGNHVCSDVESKCASGQCIPREWWCDYRKDCPDGSDEKDCFEYVRECRNDEYRCNNGQCIPGELQCYFSGNERQGCSDKSHLTSCSSWECRHDQMKCADSYCVDRRLVCDGKLDCLYTWTDEEGCPFRCSSEENCSCVDITINCAYLGLEDLPQNIEPEISRMILKGNRFGLTLEPDMFQGQASMQYLDLSDNGITYIPPGTFRSLWRLRILHLSNNQITVLERDTFAGLPNLGKINLKGNRIRIVHSFAFNGLSSLKSLDLSHQELENIFMNAFMGLRSLSALDLSQNSLSHIEDGTFSGLSNLVSLHLSNNRISVMESRVFLGLSSLRYLSTDEFRFCCLARHVDHCLPHADEFSSCEDLMSNIVLRICVWVLGVVALTGNVLVILWRAKCRLANKVHSFLITNLAIGDLLMGTYLIIIASVDAHYRGVYFIYDSAWRKSPLCRMTGFLSTLSSELSVFTLTVITLDRFLRISFPLQMRNLTWKQTQLIMGFLWLVCILLAGLPLLEIDYFADFYGRSGVCLALHITPHPHNGWEYSVFVFLALNFISFTIIAAAYIWMFVVARQTQKAVRNKDTRKNSTMAQRMMVIVMTDFCCWMPIILLGILSLNGVFIPSQVFAWVAVFVLPLNAAINPLLYTISTIPLFRRGSKRSFIDPSSFKLTEKQKILSLVPCNHSKPVKSATCKGHPR